MKNFHPPFSLLPTLQKVWQSVLRWISSSSELQVWQESDCHGCICCWHAYDPMTGSSACFGSEEEMRIWIEQCYYTKQIHNFYQQ